MNARFLIAGPLLVAAAALFGPAAAAAADNNGWRNCAAEGQTCNVRGRAVVRYGDQGRWNTRTVSGPVACNNATFGDPAPERRKRCQVRGENAGPPGGGGNAGWRRCADEGQVCRVGGRAQVRYGTAGRYVYRDVVREVRCDTRSFGRDPFDGRRKTCDIRR